MYTVKIDETSKVANTHYAPEAVELEFSYRKFTKDEFELELKNTPNVKIFGDFEQCLSAKEPLMIRLILRDVDGILHYLYIMQSKVYIMQNGKTIEWVSI